MIAFGQRSIEFQYAEKTETVEITRNVIDIMMYAGYQKVFVLMRYAIYILLKYESLPNCFYNLIKIPLKLIIQF